MNFEELNEVLKINEKLLLPSILWGRSGYGKTAVIKKYAEKNNKNLIQVDAITVQPSLVIIPKIKSDKVTLYPVPWLEEIVNAKKETILFIDEINRVESVSVFNLFISIFLSRKYQNLNISDKVQIIGACNYDLEDCGTREMPDALMKRCMHLEWSPRKTESISNLNVKEKFKTALYNLDLLEEDRSSMFKETVIDKLNCNPRQLEKALLFLEIAFNNNLKTRTIRQCLKGLIGEEANQLVDFFKNSLSETDLNFDDLNLFFKNVDELYELGKGVEVIKFFNKKLEEENMSKNKIAQLILLTCKPEIINAFIPVLKEEIIPILFKHGDFYFLSDVTNNNSFKRLTGDLPTDPKYKENYLSYKMITKLMGTTFDSEKGTFSI